MSKGNFPESLSQAMLVGTMLVGRLGVAGGTAGKLEAFNGILPYIHRGR